MFKRFIGNIFSIGECELAFQKKKRQVFLCFKSYSKVLFVIVFQREKKADFGLFRK